MSFLQRTGEWKFAAALGAALAISACAKTPAENGAALTGLNGAAGAPPFRPVSAAPFSAGVLAQAEIARAAPSAAANFHSPVRCRKLIPHSFCNHGAGL